MTHPTLARRVPAIANLGQIPAERLSDIREDVGIPEVAARPHSKVGGVRVKSDPAFAHGSLLRSLVYIRTMGPLRIEPPLSRQRIEEPDLDCTYRTGGQAGIKLHSALEAEHRCDSP
jgi:hypothetical protein